jgi:YD repeat-containing protein
LTERVIDPRGRVTRYPEGRRTGYRYDALDRRTASIYPDGNSTLSPRVEQ